MTASSSPSRSTIATRQFRASASGSASCLATALSQSADSMCCMPSAMATTGSSCGAREFLLKQAGPRDPRQRLRRPGCGHWFHHVHLLAVGRGRLSARAYPMLLANSKIGMYSSTTMVPTIAPTTSISNGSKTFPKTSTAWSGCCHETARSVHTCRPGRRCARPPAAGAAPPAWSVRARPASPTALPARNSARACSSLAASRLRQQALRQLQRLQHRRATFDQQPHRPIEALTRTEGHIAQLGQPPKLRGQRRGCAPCAAPARPPRSRRQCPRPAPCRAPAPAAPTKAGPAPWPARTAGFRTPRRNADHENSMNIRTPKPTATTAAGCKAPTTFLRMFSIRSS